MIEKNANPDPNQAVTKYQKQIRYAVIAVVIIEFIVLLVLFYQIRK
jgi:hypothetical protein